MTFGAGGADAFKEIIPITFGGFLLESVGKGCVYKAAAPPPEVVPAKGLEGIQDALDILKKGRFGKEIGRCGPIRVIFGSLSRCAFELL